MTGALLARLTVTVATDGDMSLWVEDEEGENEVVASGLPDVVGKAAFEALGNLLALARKQRGRPG